MQLIAANLTLGCSCLVKANTTLNAISTVAISSSYELKLANEYKPIYLYFQSFCETNPFMISLRTGKVGSIPKHSTSLSSIPCANVTCSSVNDSMSS